MGVNNKIYCQGYKKTSKYKFYYLPFGYNFFIFEEQPIHSKYTRSKYVPKCYSSAL